MNWELRSISSFAVVGAGQAAPQKANEFDDTGHPFVRAGSLDALCSGASEDSLERIPDLIAKERRMTLYPTGTILFAKSGMSATLGRVHKLRKPCYVVSHLATIIPTSETCADFLAHFFRFSSPARLINDGAYPSIRLSDISEWKIPFPPLDEQRRIAAVLDKADALRRQRQESLQLTEKLLQSVFLSMFGDPRENPKKWDVVPLGQLVADDDTINYGVVQPGNDYPGGVPLIRLGDLANPDPKMVSTKRIDPEIDASYARSRLLGGEVLVGCVGHTIGVACIAPTEWAGANIARAVARINVKREIPSEFILQQIRTPAIQHFFRGERRIVGQPTLNIKQIKEAPILLPPSDLRNQFAKFYQLTVNGHSDKQRSETLIDGLFSSIQQRAFRGELDLSRLQLAPVAETLAGTPVPQPVVVEGRYKRPGSFIAPADIEQQLLTMEKKLDGDKAEPLPWSEDFFKYRTLSQILQPPFSFARIWSAVEQDFAEPDYETVKNKVFEYVAAGVLKQEFNEEQREIVFRPRT